MLTVRGTDTAEVDEINNGLVRIRNKTDRVAPILVCIGPSNLRPAWLTVLRAIKRLQGAH